APLSIEGVTRGLQLEIVIQPPAPLGGSEPTVSARRAQMPVVENRPVQTAGRAPLGAASFSAPAGQPMFAPQPAAASVSAAAAPAAMVVPPASYSSTPPSVTASYTTASSAPSPTVTALLQRFAAVGLRAEQLSAFIGVRAADLS